MEAFYAYECHLAHFVFDRDMHCIIYSLGFVPVSYFIEEKNKFFSKFLSFIESK